MHKKILYIATEVDPFFKLSSSASIVAQLTQAMVAEKCEVRVIMPKFSVINERKHRIHEVQRLYGVNICVEEENISLIVKVASCSKSKVQIYFIDNEELFQTKKIFHDKNGTFYPNNDIRVAFICKAAWAILENLGWAPDIIHCFGWQWVFIPLYGKRVYNKMSLFKNIKFIQTYGPDYFKNPFGESMIKKVYMRLIKPQDLEPLGNEASYVNFLQMAKQYADATTYSFSESHTPILENLKEIQTTCISDDEHLIDNYRKMYDNLLDPNK